MKVRLIFDKPRLRLTFGTGHLGIKIPLHPNYSTSVKVGDPLPLYKLCLDCASRAILGLWRPDWGTLRVCKRVLGLFGDSQKMRPEKLNLTYDTDAVLTLVRSIVQTCRFGK